MPIHDWTRVDAGIFHHFHHDWISELSRVLNSRVLPPAYYALSEQVAGGMVPDVLALERVDDDEAVSAPGGGVAVAPRARFMFSAEPEFHAEKRYRVVIRHRSNDKVVSVVEIVSPGNKDSRSALRSFVGKSVEFLMAGIHLLVIDLFPPGRRDPRGMHAAIWESIVDQTFDPPANEPLTLVSYAAARPIRAYLEPISVGDSLPDMPLFLTDDGHVLAPLEATYQGAFEAFPGRWREVLG
jgi:hypothetical protein